MSRIYLDHNSTTPLSGNAYKAFREVDWHNPNSTSPNGLLNAHKIKQAEQIILDHINGHEGRIIWTSSGSQANNLIIQAACVDNELITSPMEHKSVLQWKNKLAHLCNVLSGGVVSVKDIHENIITYKNDPYCIEYLISIQLVNNETGVIQPVHTLKELPKIKSTRTRIHTDGVQALGKINIDVEKLGLDALSLSAHKVNGYKGIGCLWIKEDFYQDIKEWIPYLGTPNPGLIWSFATCVKEIDVDSFQAKMHDLESHFLSELSQLVAYKHNTTAKRVPGTLSLSFPGVDAAELMFELDDKGVDVSLGSACNSNRISHVLEAMSLPEEQAKSTIRISFGKYQTKDEAVLAAQIIAESANLLR